MMGLFRKSKDSAACPQNADLATVKEKLAACDSEIAQAEADLRRAALGAVLNNDETASAPIRQRLSELRSRKELLLAALQAAEQADRTSREVLNAEEHLARK